MVQDLGSGYLLMKKPNTPVKKAAIKMNPTDQVMSSAFIKSLTGSHPEMQLGGGQDLFFYE
jgi:hypothetical protein